MPLYRVQLKQGQRTIVETVESSSVDNVIAFYNAVTTMKLNEVLEIKYLGSGVVPPDDFNYTKLFKGMVKHHSDTSKVSRQVIFHNIKKTVNETELYGYIKQYLQVDSQVITGIYAGLMKL